MTGSTLGTIGIIGLLTTQACFLDRRSAVKPDRVLPTNVRSNERLSRGKTEGFGPKSVEGKTPPTRLIARDGTSCVVSEKKFDSTTLGTSVWCTWFDADR